jgi:hypothetical protein
MTRALLVVTVVHLALARAAAADIGDFETAMVNNWIDNYERNMVEDNVLRSGPRSGSATTAPSTVVPKRSARVPAQLAAKAPPGQRAALTRQYDQLLSTYEALAVKLRLPDHDISSSLALLVCGAYTAYRGGDLSDTALAATQKQLHAVLVKAPGFAKIPTAQKQDLYEQLAIVSTQIELSLVQAKTDPAKLAQVRDVAKTYLAAFGNPDQVVIDDRGISLQR